MNRLALSTGLRRVRSHIRVWLVLHLQAAVLSFGQFCRNRANNFFSCLLIGVALAMPIGLFLSLEHIENLVQRWHHGLGITVMLDNAVDQEQAAALAQQIATMSNVQDVAIVSKQQAFEEYKELSGYRTALDLLQENPLPYMVLVRPTLSEQNTTLALIAQIRSLPAVTLIDYDQRWLLRLHGILRVSKRAVWLLGLLLISTVLLIIGNATRILVYQRREEIHIIKIFGGTNRFARRPFLYTGMWLGLFGGLIASVLINLCAFLMKTPINELATLYGNSFTVQGLDAYHTALLVGFGTALGIIGSWFSVWYHILRVEQA